MNIFNPCPQCESTAMYMNLGDEKKRKWHVRCKCGYDFVSEDGNVACKPDQTFADYNGNLKEKNDDD